jgi:filamentous hemagglutinin
MWSGGHKYPGRPGKTSFPESWDQDRIMHHISDVATDPKIPWISTGKFGKTGLARFRAEGVRQDLGYEMKIRAIVEPYNGPQK